MIGQEAVTRQIQNLVAKSNPDAWLLCGETGGGKTTIARIMATSYQCTHAVEFGEPCDKCIKFRDRRDIIEINASDMTTIDVIREALQGYDLLPSPRSKNRVYILDEAQRLSKASQNLLLKYTEDCPSTTKWIICTTEPDSILRTLQRRCTGSYEVKPLNMDQIKALVKRAIKFAKSENNSYDLVEALWSNNITSPGLIVKAVQNYVTGVPAADAVHAIASGFDFYSLCRALVKGDWQQIASQTQDMTIVNARRIKVSVSKYLMAILVQEKEPSDRTIAIADAIVDICATPVPEDGLRVALLIAGLHKACKRLAKFGF